MGPRSRYLGSAGSQGAADLAGPGSRGGSQTDRRERHCGSEGQDSSSGLSIAATGLHRLGFGVDVPRFRQAWRSQRRAHSPAPHKVWEGNQPAELAKALPKLETIEKEFTASQSGGKKVSLPDLIVLGGDAAIEEAAKKAGYDCEDSFLAGRTYALQEQTDVQRSPYWNRLPTGSAITFGTEDLEPRRVAGG